MQIEIIEADYSDTRQETALQSLLNAYALDPMGGGRALEDEAIANIVQALSKLPYAFSLIAYHAETPVGLVNCFESFSTFACKPLINIHDVYVLPEYRGNGISHRMLAKVEDIARSKGCCKMTLEVLSQNQVAKSSYKKFGFDGYELDPSTGSALFWQKIL